MSNVAASAADPGWTRAPPHWKTRAAAQLAKQAGRLVRWGVWARKYTNPLGILSDLVIPSNDANLSDVVPQDDFERATVTEFRRGVEEGEDSWVMRDWAKEQIGQHRLRQRDPEPERSRPIPIPIDGNVRVDRYRRRCEVGPYSRMKDICGQYGMQAHHIVPDWTLRWGKREDHDKRIQDMPSLANGQAICVNGHARTSGSEHNRGHAADRAIERHGIGSTPPYTTRLENVKRESIIAMTRVRPDCRTQILAAANGQFSTVGSDRLVRAKERIPVEGWSKPTLEALTTRATGGANGRP